MWITETFEIKSHDRRDDRYDVYGKVLWTMLSHMTVPLTMFYRFHSSVCLVDIWKSAYERGEWRRKTRTLTAIRYFSAGEFFKRKPRSESLARRQGKRIGGRNTADIWPFPTHCTVGSSASYATFFTFHQIKNDLYLNLPWFGNIISTFISIQINKYRHSMYRICQ
jgi:hypothetical protein